MINNTHYCENISSFAPSDVKNQTFRVPAFVLVFHAPIGIQAQTVIPRHFEKPSDGEMWIFLRFFFSKPSSEPNEYTSLQRT